MMGGGSSSQSSKKVAESCWKLEGSEQRDGFAEYGLRE